MHQGNPLSSQNGRFVALDGMRGIAALGVALFHLDPAILPGGYLAVDFFFALSGFVLWQSYAGRLQEGMGWSRFMRLRIVRLYPLFALGTVFGAAYALQGSLRHSQFSMELGEIPLHLLFNLAMLPSPFSAALYPVNVPAWSLWFELIANAALAIGLFRARSLVLAGIALTSGLTLMIMARGHGAIDLGNMWQDAGLGLLRTSFSFTAGILVAKLPAPRKRPVSGLAMAGFAALAAIMAFDPGTYRFGFDALAIFAFSPLLLLAGSRMETGQMLGRISAFLGKVSYALYIIHLPVAHASRFAARQLGLETWHVAVPYILLIVAMAWAAAELVDAPGQRLLRRTMRLDTARRDR